MHRQATANARVGDGSKLAFNFLDIDPFAPVQNAQMGGLPGALRQVRQPVLRFLANIHRTHHKVAAFHQLHARAVFAVIRVLIDIPMQLQGFEKRMERALTQAHLFTDVGDFKFRRLFVKQIEDL